MKFPKITIERREKVLRPAPKRPWVMPLTVGIAAAVIVGVLIYLVGTGLPII